MLKFMTNGIFKQFSCLLVVYLISCSVSAKKLKYILTSEKDING